MILAKTVKGYGLGEAGEGRNDDAPAEEAERADLMKIRDRFESPLSGRELRRTSTSTGRRRIAPEMQYLQAAHRRAWADSLPARKS